MPGPLATAFVELHSDASALPRELEDAVRSAMEGVEDVVSASMRDVDAEFERLMRSSGLNFDEIAADADGAFRAVETDATRMVGGVGDDFGRMRRDGSDALGDIERRADAASTSIGGSFRRLAGPLVAAFGAAEIANFFGDAVSGASDLNESINAIHVTLEEGADSFLAFGESAATSLGITQAQLNEAVTPISALLKNAGLAGDDLSEHLQALATRATDVGSVFNESTEGVLGAFGAALRGETEPIRRFGVNLDQASIQAEALRLGLVKAGDEMSTQARTQAAYSLILAQTSQVQGDFANTSDGLANRQRILGAQFGELKTQIGVALLPVLTEVANFLSTTLVPALQGLGPVFDDIAATVQQHWPQIEATITSAVQTIHDTVAPLLAAIEALWANFGDNVLEFVQRVWPAIQQTISGALEVIRGVVQVVTSLIKGDWSGAWDGIKNIVHGAFNVIVGRVKEALEVIRLVVGVGLEAVGSIVKGVLSGLVAAFAATPGALRAAGRGIFDFLKEAFRSAINWIIDAWNRLEFKIPGFDPPGPGPKFGGFTLGVPDLPRLADGGVFDQPTTVIIGEAGKEVAIPLTQPSRAAELARQSGLLQVLRVGGLGAPATETSGGIDASGWTLVSPDPVETAVQVIARLRRASFLLGV